MPDKKNVMGRKIAAWILLAAALLMLLLPWLSLRISAYGRSVSVREALTSALAFAGDYITEEEIVEELRESMRDMAEEAMSEYGVYLDVDASTDALLELLLGRLTPVRTARIAGALGKLLKAGAQILPMTLDDMDPTEQKLVDLIGSTGRRLRVDAALFRILGALLILSALFAAWCVYREKPRGVLVCVGAALLMLLFSWVAVARDNGLLKSMIKLFQEDVGDDLFLGVFDNLAKLFRLTAAPFLCLIAACLAWCAMVVDFSRLRGIEIRFGGWACPVCGAKAPEKAAFCPACGAQRPPRRYCPGCGKELAPEERFCDRCGTAAPRTEPVREPEKNDPTPEPEQTDPV